MYSTNRSKLSMTALGLITLLAATGGAAQAQHAGGGFGRGGMHNGNGGSGGGNHPGGQSLIGMGLPAGIVDPLFSPKVLGALKLTSDQKTTIAGLLTTYATTVAPYQKEIATDEAAAKALYEASTYDTGSATTLAEDEATQAGDIVLAAQAVQADIYTNVLTTDQQAAYVTAVTSTSSSTSSSSSSSTDDSSSTSTSHTPMLPTLAAQILRESTTLSLTDDEITALKSIESAQITSDTADLATVKSDLTAYTSDYNASTYDEDALTSAVDTAEGDLATLLETDWAAQSAAFLTLTSDQQTTFLSATPSHSGSGSSGSGSGSGSSSGGNGAGSGSGSSSGDSGSGSGSNSGSGSTSTGSSGSSSDSNAGISTGASFRPRTGTRGLLN